MNRNNNIISSIDWWTIGLFLIIALFGWINIYGSSYSFDQTSIWDFSNRAGKQLVWLGTAIVLGTTILIIEEKVYDVLGYIFYGVMILLLLITPFIAQNIKGSLSGIVEDAKKGMESIYDSKKDLDETQRGAFYEKYNTRTKDLRGQGKGLLDRQEYRRHYGRSL